MRALGIAAAFLLVGCITDHPIGLELRPPRLPDGGPDVPSEVVAHEVRLYRLGSEESCPDLDRVIRATPHAELTHAQSFTEREAMGDAIGALRSGRYAVAALSRDRDCGVHLFGCRVLELGKVPFQTVVVELEPTSGASGCGRCRSCVAGTCTPVDAICR